MENLVKYIILFFFYSAAGWCLETTYCSIGEKRFVNRGFLTGPLCPIYGTAALILVLFIYNPLRENQLAVFLVGIVLCDIVEYVTSYLMEKLFNARWWDYTYELFNIKGRICLKHSLYWGIISVVFVNTIHPAVDKLYSKINADYIYYILAVILFIFAIDLINAVLKARNIIKLHRKLQLTYDFLSGEIYLLKSEIETKYEFIHKYKDKASDIMYQIDCLFDDFEKALKRKNKNDIKQGEKENLSNRIFHNNPGFERLTRNKINKVKAIIEDIKNYINS